MVNRKEIPADIQRQLWAESMGKCMNPDCQIDLFFKDCGDIAEKAHIDSYCSSQDNSFENLVILCPTCHTNFDKNSAFTNNVVISWKIKRKEEVAQIFTSGFNTFAELEEVVKPVLEENKEIFENYYLNNNSQLWERFEKIVLVNNKKLKLLFTKNKKLFQTHDRDEYSNLAVVDTFLLHIDEFELSRGDEEKNRQVLFPEKINSIFGIRAVDEFLLPSSESLECLIRKLQSDDFSVKLFLDEESPYIAFEKNQENEKLYLKDVPRLRQLYHKYKCFRRTYLRLESLNFILRWLKNNNITYEFLDIANISQIKINDEVFKFVYEYCLSKEYLISLAPPKETIICNLHNFNGEGCISQEARNQASIMNIELLTQNEFYGYFTKK